MKKTRGFLLAAGIVLALAFTFSCSGDDGEPSGGNTPGGGKGNNIGDYETVKIGTQTWMAENLNYAAEGSKCYNDDPENCAKYGRLYDWATAMALPPNCNSSPCSGQVQPKHRGICPSGWHIPSNADWEELLRFVDRENGGGGYGDEEPYNSRTAGKYLKATSGWNWNDDEGQSGNGTDDYKFSALSGGLALGNWGFSDVGKFGGWWSSSEYNSHEAYFPHVNHDGDGAGSDWDDKIFLFSVRCVQD